MTNIECTKCHNILSIIGDSVELPFVCVFCAVPEAVISDAAPQPQPPQPPQTDAVETAEGPCNDLPDVPQSADEPEHETATVENTNLLIADLEQQLANSESERAKTVSALKQLIVASVNLTGRYIALKGELAEAHDAEALSHQTLAKKMGEISALERRLSVSVSSNDKIKLFLRQSIQTLLQRNKWQANELTKLATNLQTLENSRTFWRESAHEHSVRKYELYRRLDNLEESIAGASFWTRVKYLFTGKFPNVG